ncbi:hypothetical protein ACKFKG_29390 [Phormidesmis sp. 146-35]
MSKAEVLKALQHLTPEETLEVIEVASRLLRQNMASKTTPAKLNLVQIAERMKPFYEESSELTQWTDEDPEDIQDYQNYA